MIEQVFSWVRTRLSQSGKNELPVFLQGTLAKLFTSSPEGKSARAAIQVFIIRVLGALLAFVLQILLARMMGSEYYGVFVVVWVVSIVLGGLSCLGLQTAVIRFITQYRTNSDEAGLRAILLFAPAISMACASLIAATGIWGLGLLSQQVPWIYYVPFILAFICLPILAIEEVQEGIARSFDMPLIALGPVFVLRPLAILIIMSIALLSGFDANPVTAMGAAIGATLISTLIQGMMLWTRIGPIINSEFGDRDGTRQLVRVTESVRKQFPEWMKVALPVFMAGGFYNLLANTDVMLIGYYMRPENVAIYFAAIKSLALVHFVQFALRAASAHHYSRYFTQNDMIGLKQYACKIAQWSFWPTLLLGLIIAIAGKFILSLFGSQFIDGQMLLVILGSGIVIRSMIGPAESLLSMSGQQNILVIILVITLVCNIMLNVFLIPSYGIKGAAIATSMAMILETLMLYVMVYRQLGFHLLAFDFKRNCKEKGQTV